MVGVVLAQFSPGVGVVGWPGVVAFEGRIELVMEYAWDSLGGFGAGLGMLIMFLYGVITTYPVTILAS